MKTFRRTKDPEENINYLFKLAKFFLEKNTKSSLIAAYYILDFIVNQYPEKAIRGYLGEAEDKLEKMGLLDDILKEKKSSNASQGIKSKL